ncbi:MAG: HPr family phosphocarrier protein [Myxococcaceae bacterium]|nr:HPr family phosphocarrier protein [Myxococcaceae bacterium]
MANVAEGEFEIINALGLHARAAAQLVKIANRYKSDVSIECEGQTVNAKSIMGVLMLAAGKGMSVKIRCTGEDGQACLEELGALIANRFGEPE